MNWKRRNSKFLISKIWNRFVSDSELLNIQRQKNEEKNVQQTLANNGEGFSSDQKSSVSTKTGENLELSEVANKMEDKKSDKVLERMKERAKIPYKEMVCIK